jgi:hypothetical protein
MRTLIFVVLSCWALNAYAGPINLASAGPFAVLGASTVTNTGSTVVYGDVGVSPGTAITGFPPGIILPPSTTEVGNAAAAQAQADALTAYNVATRLTPTATLTGQDLGGLSETAGVYFFASSAQLTGTLTLDAQGDSNADFIFQIGSTLTTASSSSVVLIDGAQGDNVFWQVGSSATLGTATSFEGNILASESVTLTTGATIGCGRAIALNGAVTMDTNTVGGSCESSAATPEPGTVQLLGMGLLGCAIAYAWRSRKQARKIFPAERCP